MVFVSEVVSPLDGLASAASVLLIMEIGIIIVLCAILAVLIAILVRWLRDHVVPPTQSIRPILNRYLQQTDRKAGQVIDAVAEVHARRASVEAVLHYVLDQIFPAAEDEEAEAQPTGRKTP